jgi:chromosome partitioning protein
MEKRMRAQAHIIVVANEKGGVGKSTLAFQCAIALGYRGAKVAMVDLDARQQTLSRALVNRERTARRLKIDLPLPRSTVLEFPSAASLCQEVARVAWERDYVIIDVAGHDSPIARRAIAIADTLVTPVNTSFVDLDLLGLFDPITLHFIESGPFARLVGGLQTARHQSGMAALDWIVIPNRLRNCASRNHVQIETALSQLSARIGCRLGAGLGERMAFRELFLLGLTHFDLRHIPGMPPGRAEPRREIDRLVDQLNLPQPVRGPDRLSAILPTISQQQLVNA